jgi:hypothetical protein
MQNNINKVYDKKEALKLIFNGDEVFTYIPTGELYYCNKIYKEVQSKGEFIQIFSHEEIEDMEDNTIFYDKNISLLEMEKKEENIELESSFKNFFDK